MREDLHKEETFIDRKRAYRSRLDKPVGPSLMITVLPSIVICLFVIMAAPYMKRIVDKFILKPENQVIRSIDVTAETETVAETGPPPSADAVILEITKRRLKEEGFDIHTKPSLEMPTASRERPQVEIKPLPLLLGNPEIVVNKKVLNPQ